jgi:hypothetical protein
LWYNTIPGDGGTQADAVYSGITTFGRLPYYPCLASEEENFDIAFIVPHLTLALHTDQALDLDLVGSGKVPAASISMEGTTYHSLPTLSTPTLRSWTVETFQ